MSIGNNKTQNTPDVNIGNEFCIQKPAKLISYNKHGESMYNRLQRLCHPKNYLKNYNKEKVNAANKIYSKLLNTDRDDINTIIGLVVMAEKELNTNLLDEYQFEKLKNIINPTNYMEPYDEMSIALSNELYSQLMQPNINFTKYAQIISQAEPLLKITEDRENKIKEVRLKEVQEKLEKEKVDKQLRDKNDKKNAIISIIVLVIIIILGILGAKKII